MTNTEARKQARIGVIRTLKNAGLVEGISLSNEKLLATRDTTFWHGVVRNETVRAKDNYVTWHIPASGAVARADNKINAREIVIAVDVFSKRSFDSEQNHKLLDKLETAFDENGFEVELASEMYENDTQLFHYPMTLYKTIYAGDICGTTASAKS